jgi:hypothetical protein
MLPCRMTTSRLCSVWRNPLCQAKWSTVASPIDQNARLAAADKDMSAGSTIRRPVRVPVSLQLTSDEAAPGRCAPYPPHFYEDAIHGLATCPRAFRATRAAETSPRVRVRRPRARERTGRSAAVAHRRRDSNKCDNLAQSTTMAWCQAIPRSRPEVTKQ